MSCEQKRRAGRACGELGGAVSESIMKKSCNNKTLQLIYYFKIGTVSAELRGEVAGTVQKKWAERCECWVRQGGSWREGSRRRGKEVNRVVSYRRHRVRDPWCG